MSLHQLTSHALLDLLKSGQASPKEAYADVKSRIKSVDGKVHDRNPPEHSIKYIVKLALLLPTT